MDETQRRKALNEAAFRAVNERIEQVHSAFATSDDEPFEIVCECDRAHCAITLTVTPRVYERVRSDAACFLVQPGHEDPEVEDIVDSGGGYLVVRKHHGEPERIAVATDPRG